MLDKLPKNIFSALLALVATLVFFFWLFDDDDSAGLNHAGDDELVPGWYWHTAHLWSFNEAGKLEQDVTAIEVKHYSEEDVTYLSQPRVTSHLGEDDIWYTRAAEGAVRENNRIIELSTDVEIRKAGDDLNMRTQRLVLDREQEMAETELAVTITSEGGSTDAVGMRAWLEQEKVELLSKVKTLYAPQ